MANEWKVIKDEIQHGKRVIKILDKVNKRDYENFFPANAADVAIKARFKNQVKEHRAEIAAKLNISSLDLTTFENTL